MRSSPRVYQLLERVVYLLDPEGLPSLTMRKRCPNIEVHGDSHWSRPEMTVLYIRTSEKPSETPDGEPIPYYERKTTRHWVRVGIYCADCQHIELDAVKSDDQAQAAVP